MNIQLRLADGVRVRHEYFGVLAWRVGRSGCVAAKRAYADVLLAAEAGMTIAADDDGQVSTPVHALVEQGLIDAQPVTGAGIELACVVPQLRASLPRERIAKPLWAHLQPFTRCNQRCVHCYCFGGPAGTGFELDQLTWLGVIHRLADYGVRDVYITGGETLLYPSVFRMAELVLALGLTCGLSTNAMAVTDRMARRLEDLALTTIQVSLDGGTAATNDRLRGTAGAFARTLRGLDRLAEITSPVINTVVTRENLHELEQVVALGVQRECRSFKFFPEKIVGRSRGRRECLDAGALDRLTSACTDLRGRYEVDIESLDNTPGCGSADTGFAVDQNGDVYPCIFGIADPGQRGGNIVTGDIDSIWFDSDVFRRFRAAPATPCERCQVFPDLAGVSS